MTHEHSHHGCDESHAPSAHCGCGHCRQHQAADIALSEQQKKLLLLLGQVSYSPMVKFVMKSSKSDHLEAVALRCVYLTAADDSLEKVKETAACLEAMEDMGLLTIDDDIALGNYDYADYRNSGVFKYFEETIAQSAQSKEFLFDTADFERGSIALTEQGHTLFNKTAAK